MAASVKKVVKGVVNTVLWPTRNLDSFVLNTGGKVVKKVPAVWNRIPNAVKTQLGNQYSATRYTVDSLVFASAVTAADHFTGGHVRGAIAGGVQPVIDFYKNHPLYAGLFTAGAAAVGAGTGLFVIRGRKKLAYTLTGCGGAAMLGAGLYLLLRTGSPALPPSQSAVQPTPTPVATQAPAAVTSKDIQDLYRQIEGLKSEVAGVNSGIASLDSKLKQALASTPAPATAWKRHRPPNQRLP